METPYRAAILNYISKQTDTPSVLVCVTKTKSKNRQQAVEVETFCFKVQKSPLFPYEKSKEAPEQHCWTRP